jgi:quercetin dioxygenase-like cupin family protein
MSDAPSPAALPADDPSRELVLADPDTAELKHVSLAGDTYTILLSGEDTAGRFTLIDMHVPAGGGPPPHRHDFEETFVVVEGEIEVTFRDRQQLVRAGETVHVPANAPHAFRNASGSAARLLCTCSPPGQEEFFLAVGDLVATRTAPPPQLSDDERGERMARAVELAPRYRTELLGRP